MNPDPSLAAEEAEIKAQIDAINNKEKKKPKHCGDFLDEPPYEREINCFCGLKNQGATCYLNSLIQLLYMAPELRNTILSLPLCKDSLDEPTEFVTATTSKYKILMALQKLFSEMQDLNIKSLTTEKVTESFGWQQNQAMVQQDIQEASRVMFDVLERALTGTNFADSIPRLYKGTLVNHLQCLSCQLIKEREESFYDLILQVKNCTSIEESLLNMLNMEKLEGSNQYFCENCNKKVDADKGIKIRKFPPILTLSLSRFEYDFTKDELKKLNDSIKFGLELDISMFSERPELYENENDRIYELAGVLIHRGSPYSGHYHAYIRDLLKEGDWKGKMQALKEKARLEKEKENKGVEAAAAGEGEKKEGEEKGLEDQSTDEEEKDTNEEKAMNDIERSLGQNQSQSNYLSQNFKVIQKKRGKNFKKNSKKNKKKKNTGYTKPTTNNKKDKKKDDDDEEDEFDDTILDDVAFPVEYSNTELQYDWFDFNDATVSPIPVNRLQIQFGGSFSENAYILVYRQKSLANNPEFKKINVQQYMVKSIETQNEAMEAVRVVYREAEAHLEVVTLYPELLNMHERKFPQSINLVENGNKLRVKFEDTVETIFTQVKDQNPKEIALVEVQVLPNNLVQFKRLLDENSFDQKIRDLKIECWSTWLIYRKDDPVFIKEVLPYCGEAFVPMRVNLRSPQFMDATVITHENTILLEFRKHIEEACGVPLEYQQLLLMEGEAPKMLNTKEEENLEEITKLGITDNSDVLVNARDPEELKQQETSSKAKNKLGTDELLSVMVERDDDKTSVKYYIDLEWTLDDLIKNIKKKLNLPLDSERRLKKSKGNVLFYEEELSKKLREFNIGEGTKLCLEKGKIPQLGSFVLRVRNQSKYKKESDPVELDITVSPNEQLLDLKRRLCMDLGLVAKNHRLFQTDWLEEPVQMFSNEEKTVRDAPLKPGEMLVLRDKDNLIPRDVIKLNLYFTKTGFHADSEYVGIIQGREDQTLMELKSMIMIMPKFSEGHPDIAISQVRIREMRHFGFFGTVFNDEMATLKTLKFESNMSIVVQILDKPEQLTDYAIVLLLKKRLVEYRTYTTYEEFVWDCSKAPTVEEFKKAVIEFKGLNIGLDEIELAKYNPDEFEWQHISKEFCDLERMKKKKKAQTKNKNKRAKPVVIDNPDEPENLKEAPYWLRDGDIVSYRLEAENPKKDDDFQSIEDEENRRRFKEGGNDEKANTQKNNNVGGFQIYTDF